MPRAPKEFEGHRIRVLPNIIKRGPNQGMITYKLPKRVRKLTIRTHTHVSSDKSTWVTISNVLLYISHGDFGRAYWVLNPKIMKQKRYPKIVFLDKKQTIKVNTYCLEFERPIDYWSAKFLLHKIRKQSS